MTREERIPITPDDIEHEIERVLNLAHEQKRKMKDLLDYSSFQFYVAELEEQIDKRLNEVLVMPRGADDVIQRTYMSGEIAGIKLALNLPQVLIEYAQESIDSARVKEENENGERKEKRDTTDGADSADSGTFFDDLSGANSE